MNWRFVFVPTMDVRVNIISSCPKRSLDHALDCPHLVPHYSNLSNAKTWRKFYVIQAQLHDAHGHQVDAKQARQMIQYTDDIINVMQIQIRARQDGGYLPFADTLPLAREDEEGEDGL